MKIQKRDGRIEAFDRNKITEAIGKAFADTKEIHDNALLEELTDKVLKALENEHEISVEMVQDRVEEVLMASGAYRTAKSYILFRKTRETARIIRRELSISCDSPGLEEVLSKIERDYPEDCYALSVLKSKFLAFSKD